jgi:hypothetical protein
MNHEQTQAAEAATHAQIQAVPHQSDAIRELDAKVRKAAGWQEEGWYDGAFVPEGWACKEPQPLKIRIRATGAVVLIGYEHAREKVLSGVAELTE